MPKKKDYLRQTQAYALHQLGMEITLSVAKRRGKRCQRGERWIQWLDSGRDGRRREAVDGEYHRQAKEAE
jgi:hypothetical protein